MSDFIPYPVCECGHRYDRHTDPADPRKVDCHLCGCSEYRQSTEQSCVNCSSPTERARHEAARRECGPLVGHPGYPGPTAAVAT